MASTGPLIALENEAYTVRHWASTGPLIALENEAYTVRHWTSTGPLIALENEAYRHWLLFLIATVKAHGGTHILPATLLPPVGTH